MRKYYYLAYDLTCICIALLVALYLRHGFPLIQEGPPSDLYLLLLVTFVTAACVLPLMHTNTSMWRFTSIYDLVDVMIAAAVAILVSNSALFFVSRLEMMPRSVPPMHWAVAVMAMGGSRILAREIFRHSAQGRHPSTIKQHVLVVGACHTAEIYLQFIKRIIQHKVVVEGFIDSNSALTNRMFQKHKVLGVPEQLPELIEQLHVHGIHIRQIVLARLLEELPKNDQVVLLNMQASGQIDLVHFANHMGPQLQPTAEPDAGDFYQNATSIAHSEYVKPQGSYPYVKRVFDVVVASVLVIMLSPLVAMTWVVVALDVGFPTIFWQQRPGQYGRPFRLYKFRTMRVAGRKLGEDRSSHKSTDVKRTTTIGKVLRRLRWDELPQLFHIIVGTMSFVGPRPLLPDDQPKGGELRLSVRPGVTGWAQINGGDALTPEEKLILDVWYIRHMSLWLDLRILLRTLLVVAKADMRRPQVIEQTKEYFRKGAAAHE